MSKAISLSIRLAEPIILVHRESIESSSERNEVAAPALVRGVLTLSLAKQAKIESIELVFESKVRSSLQGGVTETHTLLSVKETVFPNQDTSPSPTMFDKGEYSYPISIVIPPDVPPTILTTNGRLDYRLVARARRQGLFASDLTCSRDVIIFVGPLEDELVGDAQNTRPIERDWNDRLSYRIAVTGRSFPIDTCIPVQITLAPLGPVKILALTAVLDERVDYQTNFDQIARSDPVLKYELFRVSAISDSEPLLPIQAAVEAKDSPLARYAILTDGHNPKAGRDTRDQEYDDEALKELAGNGPWTLMVDVPLPCCSYMNYSNQHPLSNVMISHMLKIGLRVARGEDQPDPNTGRIPQFDVVVSFPVEILSSRCAKEYAAVPPYKDSEGPNASFTHYHMFNCACKTDRHSSPHELAPCIVHGFKLPADHGETPEMRFVARAELESRADKFSRLVSGQETPTGERTPDYTYIPRQS